MITKALLQSAKQLDVDVRISALRPYSMDMHSAPDASLFVDLHNHGHSWKSLGAWRRFTRNFIGDRSRTAPYVHLTNAYADVCNLPYLPCSGVRPTSVCDKSKALKGAFLYRRLTRSCRALDPEITSLYRNAVLNVYLSPLHQAVTESLLSAKDLPPAYVLPPLIDTSLFYNRRKPRDIDNLFVGVISEAKGVDEMRRRFSGKEIVLVGNVAPGVTLDFGTHVPHLPYSQIPELMNRAKNFVFLPRWPEPQGRVVIEAALCGCNIIANENVGALSFNYDLSDSKNYQGVATSFWDRFKMSIK